MKDELIRKLSETDTERQYRIELMDNQPVRVLREQVSAVSYGNSSASICLTIHQRVSPFPSHTHDYVELMYVCAGEITHMIGDKQIPLKEGDILLLGRSTRHSIKQTRVSDIGVNIIMSTECYESILEQLSHSEQLPDRLFEHILNSGLEEYCIFSTKGYAPIENIMENLVYALLDDGKTDAFILRQSVQLLFAYMANESVLVSSSHVSRLDTSREVMKRKIRDYVMNSYRTASLDELANILGITSSYLSRWIVQNMGGSFKEMLCDRRFEMAGNLLATTKLSVEDIMFSVGYENSSYFHREFRRRYGTTPKNWRAAY